jgi:hypothetical protein
MILLNGVIRSRSVIVPESNLLLITLMIQTNSFLTYLVPCSKIPHLTILFPHMISTVAMTSEWAGRACELIVVGEAVLDSHSAKYLHFFRERFALPLWYRRIDIIRNVLTFLRGSHERSSITPLDNPRR